MSLTNSNHGDARTGEKVKKERTTQKQETHAQAKAPESKRVRVRLIPIWLRLIIVVLLIVLCFTIGTMVGYGVIGNGKPFDALNQSTWTHIIDLVNKEK